MTNYYVSPSGNDSNTGAAGFPWLSPQRAVGNLFSGDTLWFFDGTYNQDSNVNKFFYAKDSGTPLQRITYRSINPLGAKITSSGLGTPPVAWYNEGNYCDFIGFDVTTLGNIALECNASHCRFFAMFYHDVTASPGSSGGSATTLGPGFTDNWLFNCVVDHIGNLLGTDPNNQVQGIYMASAGGGIWNCKASRASGFGLHLWHDSKNCSVYNNLSYNNGCGGLIIGGDGGSTSTGSVVANNIFYDNRADIGGGGYGIRETPVVGVNVYTNNCMFGNATAPFGLITGGGNVVNSVLADPKFVNYQPDNSGDYHLLPSSPCIDMGIASGSPPTDFYGLNRCSGLGVDIGPYELQQTTYHGAG